LKMIQPYLRNDLEVFGEFDRKRVGSVVLG
jgi:hypothetical protein